MSNRPTVGLALLALATLAPIACNKSPEVHDDPAARAPVKSKSSASASSSSAMATPPSTLGTVDVSKTGRCNDGDYAPFSPGAAVVDGGLGESFGYGGLGLTGIGEGGGAVDGGGGSIGLETVGPSGAGSGSGLGYGAGYGHGPGVGVGMPARAALAGTVTSLAGTLDPESAATTMCRAFRAFRACFPTGASKSLAGSMPLALAVEGDGHVSGATTVGGTLKESIGTCLTDAARKLAFAKSTGTSTLIYALEVTIVHTAVPPPKGVTMLEAGPTIVGRLPPEVIRRIVRANFPRFRACYEEGLKRDGGLNGNVSVRFVIDETGAVGSATSAGGTLADAAVAACIVGVYKTLSFPEPEGGKVMVTYPIDFQRD